MNPKSPQAHAVPKVRFVGEFLPGRSTRSQERTMRRKTLSEKVLGARATLSSEHEAMKFRRGMHADDRARATECHRLSRTTIAPIDRTNPIIEDHGRPTPTHGPGESGP